MSRRRIVVSGVGVISPVGNNIPTFWDNLVNGRTGIKKITSFDVGQFPTKVAGEITDFYPAEHIDEKKMRRMDRFVQFGVAAAAQAVNDSKINFKNQDPCRVSVHIGTATGGQGWVFDQYEVFKARGFRRLNPFTAASTFPNAVSSNISIEYGLQGRCDTISSGCASSLSAIGQGFNSILSDEADVAIAGGSEALLYAPIFGSYSAARVLSVRNGFPSTTPRPFDKDRDGTILGEGSGIVVLEELDHALARNAPIYCEMIGTGFTTDAFHIIAHEPTGMIMARAMHAAMKMGGLIPSDVHYISMHGMGDKVVDAIETSAVKMALGDHAYKINTSAIKSIVGHTQGACGAIELIATLLAVNNNIALPTVNHDAPDDACDLNYTPQKAQSIKIETALINTLGFGGKNACIAIRKYRG